MNRYLSRLIELIDNFRLEGANKLLDEIYKARTEGYVLSARESKYFHMLEIMIEEAGEAR